MPAALFVALLLSACGARTEIAAPERDAGAKDVVEERVCLPNCTVGHACCAGSCAGPPVTTPDGCCSCLPGEVSSMACAGSRCGS